MDDRERKELKILIAQHRHKYTSSPEIARERLIKEGYNKRNGELTPEYGGRKAPAAAGLKHR